MECYISEFSDIKGSDLYCDAEASQAIRAAVASIPLGAIHLIGSGNYHYISLFYLERIREPFELILFDNHSDCQQGAFGAELLSCGNWVLAAKNTLPLLSSIVWIDGNGDCTGSRLSEQIPLGQELPVYLSVDLDILSPDSIETLWDQGNISTAGLKDRLGAITGKRRILGADICGYTDPSHDTVKELSSFLADSIR